jgi:uncharacterized protein (TIGR01777 family)
MSEKRVILAGGSGFIGRSLARHLRHRGYRVVILTRTPQARDDGVFELAWDGEHTGPWAKSLDGADAVINLAGHTIDCPHTPENLAVITASRVNSVRALAAALPELTEPPRVWVQTSAAGFYGDTANHIRDESSPAGTGPLADVCRAWEDAFNAVPPPRPRSVVLRIGFVLGSKGGALPVLSKITKLFLGGAAGDGRQYISWIHLADLRRMFVAAIEDNLSGVYNAVAPTPVTNAAFMKELRHAWHRPWCPPAPAWAVRLGSRLMKTEPALALTSTRCLPRRFLEREFKFEFGQLEKALHDLCR